MSGIAETKLVNVLTKEERLSLLKALKALPLKARSLRGFEEAIITSGGVSLSEINPKTMECKKTGGVHFVARSWTSMRLRVASICKLHFPRGTLRGIRCSNILLAKYLTFLPQLLYNFQ